MAPFDRATTTTSNAMPATRTPISTGCALLGLGQETVKTHRKSIHRKLGIASQAELFARFTAFLAGPPG